MILARKNLESLEGVKEFKKALVDGRVYIIHKTTSHDGYTRGFSVFYVDNSKIKLMPYELAKCVSAIKPRKHIMVKGFGFNQSRYLFAKICFALDIETDCCKYNPLFLDYV